ncbi:SSI family serine proteinase inhibitor [Actinoplanes sp. NPDC026670]|uniref:SSI family serine proteinase inhibitor n=1 Tax=Actinoplanes sp. NPDC026670 TaxID=3154700 RepID=UPI003404B99A
MIRTMIGLATAFAVLAGPTGPAAAAGPSKLTLTYQAKSVQLTCAPTGGAHPKAAEACATLRGAGGDPANLKGGDSLCIMLYQPVTASVKGTWRGKTVKWRQTFGNSCEMTRATGVLFAF